MSGYVGVVARAMAADTAMVDQVAANLANVNTPGYKRSTQVAQTFMPNIDAPGPAAERSEGIQQSSPSIHWDLKSGPLKQTDRPLDLTILGDGYFEVLTDQGVAYTRLGRFSVDALGRLVNQDGYLLNGLAGPIRVETSSPLIKSNGQVFADEGSGQSEPALGTLKLVRFDDPQQLRPVGRGMWKRDDGQGGIPVDNPVIQQGALEGSNVDSSTEMVRLMQTMRHFESMQKVLQAYDDIFGVAIKKLGEV